MATDPRELKRLEKLAQQLGISETELLRRFLDRLSPLAKDTSTPSTFYEAMESLVGSAPELPSDLSTNPDHMKGFGE